MQILCKELIYYNFPKMEDSKTSLAHKEIVHLDSLFKSIFLDLHVTNWNYDHKTSSHVPSAC